MLYRRHVGLRKELNVKLLFKQLKNGLKSNLKFLNKILVNLKIKLYF